MSGPIEVWLTQRNLSVRCLAVHEDETTAISATRSLNMRGAQREVTRSLALAGLVPAGRWVRECEGETWRTFRPKAEVQQ